MKSDLPASFRVVSLFRWTFCLLSTAAIIGCGGSSGAKVGGKVTYKGAPVTGGSLLFAPIGGKDTNNPGKPVTVAVKSDGTYAATDGAVLGRHKVSYSAPVLEVPGGRELKPGEGPPRSPFDGLVPKNQEIEITASSDALDIELVQNK